MATLTETAFYARRTIVIGIVGFVLLLVGRAGFLAFFAWWRETHPLPPPPPTVAFGVLLSPQFPEDRDRRSLTYRLDTVSGTTPDLGTQARVFFMPAFRANVLGLELATALAARLGFLFPPTPDPEGTEGQEQFYSWRREGPMSGILTIDLVTGYFKFDGSWKTDGEVTGARAPTSVDAERIAKEYLRRAGILEQDLEKGKSRVEYLSLNNDVLVPVVSQSQAQVARVHLFRSDVEKLAVVTPTGIDANVMVLVSGAKSEKQVLQAVFHYSPVELERFATYPLRSSQLAWEELQRGGGVVVGMEESAIVAVVRNVELAYYDSKAPQEFLQPVYVFRGDNGFIAYVPAVDAKWLKEEEEKSN